MLAQASQGRAYWLLVAAVLLLAAVLRLPGLADRSLWLDEAYSAWFAALPLHELWTDAPRYETHPPAYYTLLKGWIVLLGNSEAALRSLSLIASLATVMLVACSGRLLRAGIPSDRIALLGALLVAINPASIVYAQEARPYALQTFAATGAILSALSMVVASGAAGATTSLRPLAIASGLLGLCAGGTLWLHNTGLFIAFGIWSGLGVAILAVPHRARLSLLVATFCAGTMALAIWAPFLPMLVEQSRSVAAKTFWVRAETSDLWSAWLLVSGGPSLLAPVALAALLGLVVVWRRSRAAALLVAAIAVLPMTAMLAVHFAIRPIFIDRLFVWMAPLVMALAALGLLRGPSTRLVRLALAVLIFGLGLASAPTRPALEDWRGLVATIAAQARPGDAVVALPSEIDPAISYYVDRNPGFPPITYVPGPFPYRAAGRIHVGNLGAPMVEPGDAALIAPVLEGARRIWLVSRRGDLYDPRLVVRHAVAKGRRHVGTLAASPVTLELFE